MPDNLLSVAVAMGTLALQTRDQRREATLKVTPESIAASEELDTTKDSAIIREEAITELPSAGYSRS